MGQKSHEKMARVFDAACYAISSAVQYRPDPLSITAVVLRQEEQSIAQTVKEAIACKKTVIPPRPRICEPPHVLRRRKDTRA